MFVRFETNDVIVLEEYLLYDFNDIIAAVGGSLGLFLGFSCLQVAFWSNICKSIMRQHLLRVYSYLSHFSYVGSRPLDSSTRSLSVSTKILAKYSIFLRMPILVRPPRYKIYFRFKF